MALNMNLFLLWQGKKKQHIWHKYKLFYPPGERCAQVSWRQFKCNGASKLIFPKIIQSQPILAAFLSTARLPACDPPHSPHLGFQSFSWEYIEHRGTSEKAPRSSFIISKSFSSARNGLEKIIWWPVLKVVAILNSFIGMPRCDAMKTIKHEERCGVGNRIECMFVFTVCLWALMHGIEIAWFCIHLCFCVYVLL